VCRFSPPCRRRSMRTRQPERPISERRRRWLERAEAVGPVGVAAIAVGGALMFVGFPLLLAARQDVSPVLLAGPPYTGPDAVDPPIHVFDSEGYDGQFYFRLAIAPGQAQLGPVHGVRFDNAARVTRVGYPALAYALSLGQPSRAPWMLVLANVLVVGVVA